MATETNALFVPPGDVVDMQASMDRIAADMARNGFTPRHTDPSVLAAIAKLTIEAHMCRVDSAMCIWEAIITADHVVFSATSQGREFTESVNKFRGDHGTATMREIVAREVTPWVDSLWHAANDKTRDNLGSFDWDFVPIVLAHCVRFTREGGVIFLPWEG